MDKRTPANRQRGLTLIELMIAVIIVGVLAAIGYPSYQQFVRKSKRSDAHSVLSKLAADQERLYSNSRTYTEDLTDLGYANAGSTTSPEGYWSASVVDGNDADLVASFTLTASPIGTHVDDECNTLILTSLGEKRSQPKGSTDFNPPGTCW